MASSPLFPDRRTRRSTRRPPLPFPRLPASSRNPIALWHLLSLDAPTVAALWTWFLARVNHLALPATSIAAMATAVWLLYAADRLLDARMLDARSLDGTLDATIPNSQPLEARHRFHHRHRRAFLIGIAAATLALAALLPTLDPAAIRLYLIEASFLVGYFVLIHATRSAHRLPKELAVGLFFAAATFIPTIARDPALRLPLLAPALLFAVLCSLNCLFIYAWEHPRPHTDAHPITRIALRYLHPLALSLLAAAIALTLAPHLLTLIPNLLSRSVAEGSAFLLKSAPTSIPAAIAIAALLLLLLDHYRHRLSPTLLRAAADLALLTPLLFFR
ncbi:MAG: hypothetical protein ABI197_13585 [Granulicella sp.]